MKQAFFWKIVIATNICFLFLVIHKSSRSIQTSYDRQKLVQEKEALLHRQEELTHKLYALKSLNSVKRYAQHELGMKSCSLKQVKQLTTTLVASVPLADAPLNNAPKSTHNLMAKNESAPHE